MKSIVKKATKLTKLLCFFTFQVVSSYSVAETPFYGSSYNLPIDVPFYEITKLCSREYYIAHNKQCDLRKSFILGTHHEGVSISDLPKVVSEKLLSSKFLAVEHAADVKIIRDFPQSFLEEAVNYLKFDGEPLTESQRLSLIRDWHVDPEIAKKATSTDCPLLLFGHVVIQKALDLEIQATFLRENAGSQIQSLETREDRDSAAAKAGLPDESTKCDIRSKLGGAGIRDTLVNDISEGAYKYLHGMNYPNDFGSWPVYNGIRNENWIPKILALHEQGQTFIAVGSWHIHGSGEKSLRALLEKLGYSLTQVK